MTRNNGLTNDQARSFPSGFFWGCGASPTQIEGQTVNEWADYLARDGTKPDDGPNGWVRYRYDFRCLGDLNQNAYRIGFDWGRLQPGPGDELDRDVSFRYMEMLAELRSLGVEPFLTLFHFACPTWLAVRGGWLCDDAPEMFADFTRRLVELTDGEVLHWITFNEPAVYAFMAYVLNEFPPRKRGRIDLARRVIKNKARAHALAYEEIKKVMPDAQVGITKHFKRFRPLRSWHPVDRIATFAAREIFDRWGLDVFLKHRGKSVSDFIGVNYYGCMRMKGLNGISPLTGYTPEELERHGAECDDMWEQDSAGLVDCLREVSRRSGLPLFITENGVATEDEGLRTRYLIEHLESCHEAIRQGIDLRGYFYWSLVDNFEWGEGLSKRFGLLEVDFEDKNRRRSFRPAANVYAKISGDNALPSNRQIIPGIGSLPA